MSSLNILQERWREFVVVLLASLIVAAVVTFLTPTKYDSSLTLYVSTQTGGDSPTAAYQGAQLSEQRVTSYVELLTGARVGSEVAQSLGEPASAGPAIAGELSASAEPDSVLLSVTARDESPVRAMQIVNAVGEVFPRIVAGLEQPADLRLAPPIAVRVVQPATVPSGAVQPNIALNMLLGLVIGLALASAAAVISHRADDSVKTDAELAGATNSPVLGVLPMEKSISLTSGFDEGSETLVEEGAKRIRTNLEYIAVGRKLRAITISSAVPGEGKSTAALFLAKSLAASGRRVLVIDADLRRPQIAGYVGLTGTVGLTTVLTGKVRQDEAIQQWGGSSVFILTSGEMPPNPSELLGSEEFSRVISQAEEKFDYILIDSPPLLPVTDAAVTSSRTDGLILICRSSSTSRRDAANAIGLAKAAGAEVLGTVLNMSAQRRRSAYYYASSYAAAPTRATSTRSASNAAYVVSEATTDVSGFRVGQNEDKPSPTRREWR